jgi:hypothetical protein
LSGRSASSVEVTARPEPSWTSQVQPDPKLPLAACGELVAEPVEGAEGAVDRLGQVASGRAAPVGGEALPEERVVPDLGDLVEQLAVGLEDHVLQLGVGPLPVGELVGGVHVGLVVLAVVELQRLGAHVGSEGVDGVRKRGQGEGHGSNLPVVAADPNGAGRACRRRITRMVERSGADR